ncbi:MAG TPA: hypothetical protein VFN26_21475 [Candidatus Acidoferrum sp.]|nr:hypothetical protein [Candidatus Acidoferrum sp.]
MKKEEATPTQKDAIPTLEEYEAALAELEKIKERGAVLQIFAAHMSTALSYELAHGIRPTSWEKFG